MIQQEAAWCVPFLSPDEAVQEAMRLAIGASRPVVIADTQDNPGAGGDANTMEMLHALCATARTTPRSASSMIPTRRRLIGQAWVRGSICRSGVSQRCRAMRRSRAISK
jgi:hypothetical protein